jgi:hypothetical protein
MLEEENDTAATSPKRSEVETSSKKLDTVEKENAGEKQNRNLDYGQVMLTLPHQSTVTCDGFTKYGHGSCKRKCKQNH